MKPTEVKVVLNGDGEERDAVLVAKDGNLGIAFVRLVEDPATPLPALDLSAGADPKVGEALLAVGRKTEGYDYVPLLLRLPGVTARRSPAIVSLSDVMPTLLDLLGLRTPDYVQARSLLPVIAGAERRDRPVVSEQRIAGQAAIRLGDLKYIRAAREMLFDLAADPGETQNLLPAAKQRVYPVSLVLDRYSEVSQALKTRFGSGRAPKLDAETRRQLQALGYLGP